MLIEGLQTTGMCLEGPSSMYSIHVVDWSVGGLPVVGYLGLMCGMSTMSVQCIVVVCCAVA